MKKPILTAVAFICLALSVQATSCIVAGYEGKLARPLTGTYADKTAALAGELEGLTHTAFASSAGPFDSFVWTMRETAPGPLCSLPLGFLLLLR